MSGEVRTTYVGAIGSSVDPTGEVLGVTRADYDFVDRAVDKNVPELGPPNGLLSSFKRVEESAESDGGPDATRIAWETVNFRDRYLAYIDGSASSHVDSVQRRIEDGRTVWLVCLEKETTFCHRRLLSARLRGEEPIHWSEMHDPVDRDDADEGDRQEGLDAFA